MSEEVVRAAGAVLWRVRDETVEIALIHRPKYDDWSLPKGKLHSGEHPLAAAVREVREETGHQVALGRPLPTQRYTVEGRPKVVDYWAAEARSDAPFVPNDEVDDLKWLPTADAITQLTYARDADLLRAFAECPVRTWPVILLRHAEAEDRESWTAPDRERPLTQVGLDQARRLPPLLAAFGVKRVVSSDARRCIDTVRPYAALAGREIESEPVLSEDRYDEREAARIVRALRDAAVPVVVCTHRPVLPDLAATLLEGAVYEPPQRILDPGAFWVLHLAGRAIVGVEEHAP